MIKVLTAYTLSECMELMGKMAAENEKAGEKNIIFCEDRLTLIAERMLVKSTGGTFDSSVTTFARFLKGSESKVLGKQGSVMAVGKCIAALQREGALKCFSSPASIAAQAKAAYETLAQFSASCVDSEMLQASADSLPACALKNKLEDLSKIFKRYEGLLQQYGYLDEAKYLSLLPNALQKDEGMEEANVFFLCFPSFTGLALSAVKVAAKKAKNVVGIFCCGDEAFYTGEGVQAFVKACEKIAPVQVENRGVPLGGEAEHLRKTLFNAEYRAAEVYPTDKVRIFAGADRAAEAEYAAVQIKKHLSKEEGLRYRDIAVLLPSVEAYSLAIKKAFEDYEIPYFIDEKKTLKNHPLCRFLLSAFACVESGYAPADVQALAGNYFFGDGDEYRNYLLQHANFRGGATRAVKEGAEGFELSVVKAGREKLLEICSCIPKKQSSGKAYCAAVRAIFEKINAQEGLEQLCAQVEDVATQGYLGQFFPALEKVLAEAELLTADNTLKVEAFATMLEEGLEATEISLIPLKMDAVFVGDLDDSRIEKVRVLLALGLTADVPRAQMDEAFISDADIARLKEIKTQIDPTVRQVNARAKEAAALNLCTFTDRLHLTYPLSVGEETSTVSEMIGYVKGAFCKEGAQEEDGERPSLPVEKTLSKEDFIYLCSEKLPAVRKMLQERGLLERGRIVDGTSYRTLLSVLQKLHLYEERTQVKGQLQDASELFFDGDCVSPTTLEMYFECPYKMLMDKGLRLQERKEEELVALDTGNFVHAVLQWCVNALMKNKRERAKDPSIAPWTEADFCAKAEEAAKTLFASPRYALDEGKPSNNYLKTQLIEECVEASRAVFYQIEDSAFSSRAEVTIGLGEKCHHQSDKIKGKVDRVDENDEYVRVVDYKTGNKEASPTEYYVGEQLQMQLYMDALKGEKTPAGIFYFLTNLSFSKDKDVAYKLEGFINGDAEALKASDTTLTEEGQKSAYFNAKLGGKPSNMVMTGADFADFLAYAPLVAERAKEEMRKGQFMPNPYDGACQYCSYAGLCGYNSSVTPCRKESSVKSEEIVRIVREEREAQTASDSQGDATESKSKQEDATEGESNQGGGEDA